MSSTIRCPFRGNSHTESDPLVHLGQCCHVWKLCRKFPYSYNCGKGKIAKKGLCLEETIVTLSVMCLVKARSGRKNSIGKTFLKRLGFKFPLCCRQAFLVDHCHVNQSFLASVPSVVKKNRNHTGKGTESLFCNGQCGTEFFHF